MPVLRGPTPIRTHERHQNVSRESGLGINCETTNHQCSFISSCSNLILMQPPRKYSIELQNEVNYRKVDDDFHQLPTKCKNAEGEKYIQSFESGTNISIENMSQGYTHVAALSSGLTV